VAVRGLADIALPKAQLPLPETADELCAVARDLGADPQAYLADVLSRLVNGWPMRQIDELLPWAYAARQETRAVA
jgi:hypothetical protein